MSPSNFYCQSVVPAANAESTSCATIPLRSGGHPLTQKRIIDYQGRKVEGELIDFQSKNESWNQYELADGSSMKMKVVLLEIMRLLNEHNPAGEPVYVFTAQQITAVDSPDHLKKKTN
jgi:hypothetical protein